METKEWDLREGDFIIPVDPVLPPKPRYAIVVKILSVEQPWLPEPALTVVPAAAEEPPVEKPAPENVSTVEKTGKDKKGAAAKKNDKAKDKTPATKDGAAARTTASAKDADNTQPDDPLANGEPAPRQLSKASFSFQFPGVLPSPDVVAPDIGEAVAPEIPPPPPPPPPEPVEGDTDLDEPEEPDEKPPEPPPPPTTRFVSIPAKEFDVESNYRLWHKLLQEPLVVTMYWTSPSGAIRLPFAQACVDLFPVLALKEGALEGSYKLEKIPVPPVVVEEEKPVKTKKGAKSAKENADKDGKLSEEKDKKKKKKKGEAEVNVTVPEETIPALVEGAEMKIALSTTNPFWCEEDIVDGVVLEIAFGIVRQLPSKVVDFGLNPPASTGALGDPFSYTLALEIPGFFGLKWWDEITNLSPEEKVAIAQVRIEGGRVEVEEIIPEPEKKASIIPPEGSVEEMLRAIRKAEEARAAQEAANWESVLAERAKERLEELELEELKRKLLHSESIVSPVNMDLSPPMSGPQPYPVLRWPDCPVVKRFLPCRAAKELKDLLKKDWVYRGELARVVKPSLDFPNTSFDKYHGCFFLNLHPFLEEGCWAFQTRTLLLSYSLKGTRSGIPLIQPPPPLPPKLDQLPPKPKSPPKGSAKKPPKPVVVPVDEDPPLPVCPDPDNPLPNNAWQLSDSVLLIKVQTSRPLERPWTPPPEPEISLDTVIPPRPKQASVYDSVKMAIDKFSKFVEFVGQDLISMHQDLTAKELYEEDVDKTRNQNRDLAANEESIDKDPNAPPHRFETKGAIRKKMVRQLHKQGLWHDIREEMKTKVLNIATEKYRERQRHALDIGKFEFCNNLYISLSEVIFNTLKNMIEKRKEKKSEILDNLGRLRQLADEYEAEEDYKSASKCHQERLLGDNMHDPNIWFEYGCFCMRVRPKDQGKAEECWREALTLNKRHLFSLQALGCLMWHRGYLTQAEVMFHNAINEHPEEEHINWVLLSQVFAAQGKKDFERSCLKRAEVLYFSRQHSQNSYSPPHQLLSPLWIFPYSISLLSLLFRKPGGLFVDSAMLLLNLHLPKEAEVILGLETEVYSCTLDNKWCRARVAELNGNLEQAQNFIKDAIKLEKENPTSWLLLGHMRYNYDPPDHFTDALQTNVYRGAIDAFTQYRRYVPEDQQYKFSYLEMGYSYFKLGAYDEARKIFLKGCTILPTSPALWLAVGIAYFYVGNLNNAELALVEGNVLDTYNFKIWAYLTLTCLREERHEEAEVSFQQGLKCVVDPDLLVTIAEGFARIGNFRDAEEAYLQSLKARESAAVRLLLAEMYYKQGIIQPAKENYEKVVKAPDVKLEDKSVSISRLTELQDHAGPNPPINRHRKNHPIEI